MILSHGSIAHTRFRTCRTSSFCTVAWQLARFQLTRRIARSLGDSWASCAFSLHFVLSFFNWQQRAPHYGVVSECVSLVNWRRWSWWNSPREWDHSPPNECLQCLDTVGWASWASGLYKLSDGVLVRLSVWSEVQIVCMWFSWCQCIPKPPCLLPHLNPDWSYLSGTSLPYPGCPGKEAVKEV